MSFATFPKCDVPGQTDIRVHAAGASGGNMDTLRRVCTWMHCSSGIEGCLVGPVVVCQATAGASFHRQLFLCRLIFSMPDFGSEYASDAAV